MKGKGGRNPYIAGTQKFAVIVNGIDVLTGNYSTSATDLMFEGGYGVPINVSRSYSANNGDEGPVGRGWTLSVDIRNTAGGLLKGPGSPVRSVPHLIKERYSTVEDPHADPEVTEPVEAVIQVDASGFEETVQRDVDGVLTSPAWDKNVNDCEYETIVNEEGTFEVLVSNTITTPEGSVYVYTKQGEYPEGTHPWYDPGTTDPEPSNVLKISTVTDRHGNVTTYHYSTTATAEFEKSNGTVEEYKLESIDMPGGHEIVFTWGNGTTAPTNRIYTASDGTRTVTYGYDEDGNLISVTSPEGKETEYGYGGPEHPMASTYSDLLTSITDCRGLTTTMAYVEAPTLVVPPFNVELEETGVVCYRVEQPNDVTTHLGITWGEGGAYTVMFGDFEVTEGDDPGDPRISYGQAHIGPDETNPEFTVTMSQPSVLDEGNNNDPVVWKKTYDSRTHDLIRESRTIWPYQTTDLHDERRLQYAPFVKQVIETETSYNFMGSPLEKTVTEKDHPLGGSLGPTRVATIQYAYHGADKFYQQKAVKDQAGRFSYTDYYDDEAADGKKGQVYRVYADAYADFDNETGSGWRSTIVPESGTTYSAEFDYDDEGRCTLVKKLHAEGSPDVYVHTATSYGADGSTWWGNAATVVEDADYSGHTGIKRTTETLAYDSIGRATLVKDGANREFATSYDLDGRVESIKRTDTTPDVDVVTYTYGTSGISNGVPTIIVDELSGITQTIGYVSSGGGIGQVASIEEDDGAVDYTISYEYDGVGSRSKATYDTDQGVTRWGYKDYLWVGGPENGGRVFQTLNKLNSSSAYTSEEFHYQFDAAGRLSGATFAMTPDGLTSAPFYTDAMPAKRRARAWYKHDPAGRLLEIKHFWDQIGTGLPNYNDYTANIPLLGASYTYETSTSGGNANRGLKLTADFTKNVSGSFTTEKKQDYQYHAALDYLTQARYDDDGNASWDATHTWTYDAAGNRATENGGSTWTYDELNRILTSPSVTYGHDILGNRTSQTGSKTFSWDLVGRMTAHNNGTDTFNYRYRADGMRTTKKKGGGGVADARFFYDGQMLSEEYFSGTTYPRDYVQVIRYGLGARGIDYIERVRTDPVTTLVGFPIYDGHGNMVATLSRAPSDSYTLGDQRHFDAWGKIRAGNTSGEPNPRYVASLGHSQDDESGLIYMRARYYEPGTGRFVSQDVERDGRNYYVYCWNNPISGVDPSGNALTAKNGGFFDFYMASGFLFYSTACFLLLCPVGKISAKEVEAAAILFAAAAASFDAAFNETPTKYGAFMKTWAASGIWVGLTLAMAAGVAQARYRGFVDKVAIAFYGLHGTTLLALLIGMNNDD